MPTPALDDETSVLDRLYAMLDSRFLARIGGAMVLVSIGGFIGSVLIALVVAAVALLTHVGWVPLLFLGFALLLALVVVLTRLRARSERRARAHDPAAVARADRLQAVADQVEALYDARRVEEPRQQRAFYAPIDDNEHLAALEDYRKKTMALYYEHHRADALNAFDACAEFGYTRGRERERGVIQEPPGTAALRLVPGILREMGWKLIGP
jgi:hypothetical protein